LEWCDRVSWGRRSIAGMECAIIFIVNAWTIILAIFVLVTHCVALFWPRKPLKVPLDENGLPMLWCNETEQKKDVACVWWGDEADAQSRASTGSKSSPRPVTSFSDTVRPLSGEVPVSRRSVA